jgi:hypothetical protein
MIGRLLRLLLLFNLIAIARLSAADSQAASERREVGVGDSSTIRFAFVETSQTLAQGSAGSIALDALSRASEKILGPSDQPLWRIAVRDANGKDLDIRNTSAWRRTSITTGPLNAVLTWSGPEALDGGAFEARIEVRVENRDANAFSFWTLAIDNGTSATIREVTFPNVAIGPLGGTSEDDEVVFPRGPGERRVDPFHHRVNYSSEYPTGWGSYQFMTHYEPRKGGLYVATHDPVASTKRFETRTIVDRGTTAVLMAFHWPAADSSVPGNDFRMPGPAVIALHRGDWYDAAQIYREWARQEAKWWPRDETRADTPRWMHEIAIWAQTGGTTQSVVGPVSDFARYMGVPTAFHWYNWHAIPFDNDYPHYFPAKPGFADGVRALQKAGVRVMPYINGRLWDSDLADFQAKGIAAATKNEKGEPYLEEYGSKQKLAAMCPTTPLWRDIVTSIVLRLLGPECGVDGVYIDQIAAAAPRLCYDRAHGHPLAGGHWWTADGYWPMLERLQCEMQALDPQKMITTECNAEPYIHVMDAYLTWHWQHDGQLPVFPAIYGGVIQMYGRAYRGGPTKALADRMKAAQSLVFGEQIGWMGPEIIKDEVNGPYIRRVARMRYALRDFLADGRMLRVPRLEGAIPEVTADWQWSGAWPVTLAAVQAGAWQSRDGRRVLIFANVTSGALEFKLASAAGEFGYREEGLRLRKWIEAGPGEWQDLKALPGTPIRLDPYDVVAYEIPREEK